MMEVEAAVLWGQSVERHEVRYVCVIADGDYKAYDTVCEQMPYGPEINIAKEECVNHVSKRLGTALRTLTADLSKKGWISIFFSFYCSVLRVLEGCAYFVKQKSHSPF